jgi:endo-1,4-beta-xylanase
MLTRRNFLEAGIAATLATRLPAANTLFSLKDVARERGLRFGSDSDTVFSTAPTAYSALFAQQCELFAPLMSWSYTNPSGGGAATHEDPNMGFAREHGLKLTGGHLLWYKRSPQWLDSLSATGTEKAILDHVDATAAKYKDILYSWNVVNEAIQPDADEMRPSVYQEKFGLDYFHFTAVRAKEAAPQVIRVYNDYGLEFDTPKQALKRKRLLTLLDYFKTSKTPIEAIGIQSHLRLGRKDNFSEKVFSEFLKEISDRGFKIMITELDVFDQDTPPEIETRDRMVADLYRRYLDTALANPHVTTVVTWGLCDSYTWLKPSSGPSFVRTDGVPSRPLLFDSAFEPKPAFNAVLEALRHAPKRTLA